MTPEEIAGRIKQQLTRRYITPSSDMFVQVASKVAIDGDMLWFCKDCGAIVYRGDLHDEWHERTDNPEASGG